MKKVLVIGAGFLQGFVIRRAKELGYCTYAADGNPKAVGFAFTDGYRCIDIVDAEACLQYAEEIGVDGVLTAATDYGVLTASWIAERLGLPGIHYSAAQRIKNKYLVRKRLFECHVDDTEQSFEVTSETDLSALSGTLHYPVMVKPCDGSGSRGASRVNHRDELESACHYAMEGSLTHRAEIESFITGEEYGVESFVENGRIHVLGVMKKWMTKPPYYAELGHALPSGLPEALECKVRACVEKAIQALDVNFGSVNMDLLITGEGSVHIVDVGARMGGNLIGSHIIPIGTGIDYMGNMIRAAVGDPVDFSSSNRSVVATRLLALTPGRVKALPDFAELERKFRVSVVHHLKIGDEITPYRTNLDGCGYVVASGNNVEDCVQRAEEVRRMIDIGIMR